jgi:hypothetical protein
VRRYLFELKTFTHFSFVSEAWVDCRMIYVLGFVWRSRCESLSIGFLGPESFLVDIHNRQLSSCRQAEQLKSLVAQLSARCQEQQQDLDFLKVKL